MGSLKCFKTYIGNRVSNIVDLLGPERWCHVSGLENPADWASRGLYPSELIDNDLWWEGHDWLKLSSSHWPDQMQSSRPEAIYEEEKKVSLVTLVQPVEPVISFDQFSSLSCLKRVTAWIMQFVEKSLAKASKQQTKLKHT